MEAIKPPLPGVWLAATHLHTILKVGNQLAIEQAQYAVGIRRIVLRVGNHNHRCTLRVKLLEQVQHLLTIL